jgi:hypothetical protein
MRDLAVGMRIAKVASLVRSSAVCSGSECRRSRFALGFVALLRIDRIQLGLV